MFTPPPLSQDFFMKGIDKFYAYDFLAILLRFHWLTCTKNFKALAALGSCHLTSSRQWVNENLQFSRLLERISDSFQYFSREIFMVARSYRVLATDIKNLLVSDLVSLETRLKVLSIF